MSFQDIYFEEQYGKLCQMIEGGTCKVFELDTPDGVIRHQFLKRHLPPELDPEQNYFDITTPYGYGGPIITELRGDQTRLLDQYASEFEAYCQEHNIVSEFIRFHPILKNHETFSSCYQPEQIRRCVVTELDGTGDPLTDQFSKSARKIIRHGLKSGAQIEILEGPTDLTEFSKIYYDTMDRNEAEDFYYFSPEYFQYICDHLRDHIINVSIRYEGKVIASGIYFINDQIMQVHLSGTYREFLHLSPAYLLRYGAIDWANRHGITKVHHGGGVSNSPEDPLLQFKLRFTKSEPLGFFIGRKIHDENVYQNMVELSGMAESSYFPKYRGKK